MALARQVRQPHNLAWRLLAFLLFAVVVIVDGLNRWLADHGRQFDGDPCKYVRWGQHEEMHDTQRVI